MAAPPNAPNRYYLSIKQTLRMYFTSSLSLVSFDASDELVWELAQKLARKGPFDEIRFIEAPASNGPVDLDKTFESVDSTENRLIVLDPRHWTLLNGKDAQSRAEITALLGLGATAMRVDNAASCVIACVNTQRRDVARKRAAEVLAWRNVVRQINTDEYDELREATAKRDEAEAKLRKDLEKAFQHYAYIVRAGDLDVEFKRFDDDSQSSLRGDQVWTALVAAGRATVPHGLSADYLATLLDTFDRALTPKEVVQSFFKNPAFPLVPSTEEVRRVIYELLHRGWELVDSDGNGLAVASPATIAIASIAQSLRRKVAQVATPAAMTTAGARVNNPNTTVVPGGGDTLLDPRDDPYRADPATIAAVPDTPADGQEVAYKRYIVELSNRSLTAPDAREQVWQLLRELAKVLDRATPADHQLLNLTLTLTTAEGHQGALEVKAQQAGGRVRVEDDDF